MHVCNPRAERTERLRQADPWDFLAINSIAVADPLSENKVDEMIPNIDLWLSHEPIRECTWTNTDRYC